jgi:hypothetical protein
MHTHFGSVCYCYLYVCHFSILNFGFDGVACGDQGRLRKECTVLVVSHDLAELAPLVDRAWQMLPGGRLQPADWSAGVPDLSDLD